MRFNKHLGDEVDKAYDVYSDDKEYNKYFNLLSQKVGNAYFDARIYGVDSEDEAYNSVMFRTRDCVKNSISMYSQSECSHKELQGKNGKEQIAYTIEKTGKDWHDIQDRYKYGIFVKKERYDKVVEVLPGISDSVGEEVKTVERSRFVTYSIPMSDYSQDNINFVMCNEL